MTARTAIHMNRRVTADELPGVLDFVARCLADHMYPAVAARLRQRGVRLRTVPRADTGPWLASIPTGRGRLTLVLAEMRDGVLSMTLDPLSDVSELTLPPRRRRLTA